MAPSPSDRPEPRSVGSAAALRRAVMTTETFTSATNPAPIISPCGMKALLISPPGSQAENSVGE